jgi:hypothetical protein
MNNKKTYIELAITQCLQSVKITQELREQVRNQLADWSQQVLRTRYTLNPSAINSQLKSLELRKKKRGECYNQSCELEM